MFIKTDKGLVQIGVTHAANYSAWLNGPVPWWWSLYQLVPIQTSLSLI